MIDSKYENWRTVNYDDSDSEKPNFLEEAASAEGSLAWLLKSKNLPLQRRTEKNFKSMKPAS